MIGHLKSDQIKPKVKIKIVTVKSVAQLKKKAQKIVNKLIRERDKDLPCISCGKVVAEKEAGHFIAQGSSGFLRYHPDNLHGQCASCNRFKHGNLLEYRINLVTKIGVGRVRWLELHRKDVKKWKREELEEIFTLKELK